MSVKLQLSYKSWNILKEALQIMTSKAPMVEWEVESCLLAEFYQAHIKKFTYWNTNKTKKMVMTMKDSEAFALVKVFEKEDGSYPEYIYSLNIFDQLPKVKQ